MDKRLIGVLFASVTTLFWGFLAIALEVATGLLDPLTIVWFRFLVAFSILFLYFGIRKPQYLRILYSPPLYIIIASLGLGINYLAFLYGLKFTSPGTSQVIIQIGPIFLGVVGLIFFRESISRRQATGFLIAGSGMLIFYRESITQIVENEDLFNMGVLWVVVAAMAWVVYATLQKMLVKTYPAQQLNLFLFGLPVLLFLPFVKFSGFANLTLGNWLLMIYLGCNTLIAYGSLAMAFKYLEANKVSVILALNPIITFIAIALLTYLEVSWIVPEHLTLTGFIAAMLVVGGAVMAVAFANPKKKREIKEIIKISKSK